MLLFGEEFIKIVDGVNTFWENHEFVFRIDVRRNKAVEIFAEFVEFRVFVNIVPFCTQRVQNNEIVLEHIVEYRLKIFFGIKEIFFGISLIDNVFHYLVQIHSLKLQIFDIQFRCYDNFVFVKHLYHIFRNATQRMKRFFESKEAAFKSLYHVSTVNACQTLTYMNSVFVFLSQIGL